ncbi:isocitrate lyase/phosphoenolpyruvate mutase family protein [Massilia sp. MB5]|uniref:isocitrate lyase/PEP mutase family protein n=1 Tax=Massilia sp. MB5 TaxID=2919578 RepID=UPI001F1168ED|nr:isocitrate lyase/phosphoenolpyruvate mutase family protein [Massilia sp. MB5]UMR28572.1 isocitrate lyase/phosphoenolpyruvate mutase family protein [Massilia sp. MB5]
MTIHKNHDNQFHALHADGLLMLPNCWDAGSARLAAASGARALATSSAAVAWGHGYADGGQLPADLLLSTVSGIQRRSGLPLSIDIEDGYSDDPERVAALVGAVIDAGAVGINIEDGAQAPELLVRKIAAVRRVAEQRGVKLFINARCDVFLRQLLEPQQRVQETARRAQLYREAGADGLFAPFISAEDEIRSLVAATPLPLNVLAMQGLPAPQRLLELGVRRLSAGSALSESMFACVQQSMQHFMRSGEPYAADLPKLDYGQLNGLMQDGGNS